MIPKIATSDITDAALSIVDIEKEHRQTALQFRLRISSLAKLRKIAERVSTMYGFVPTVAEVARYYRSTAAIDERLRTPARLQPCRRSLHPGARMTADAEGLREEQRGSTMGLIDIVPFIEGPKAIHLLTRQAVCARVSLSKTKVYDLIREGRFPKAHEVEPGIRRWRSDEVGAWIDARAPLAV